VTLPAGYMRVGAIDIGTNSIRLLVADIRSRPGPRELVTVARAGEPCRLGRGLGRSGEVDDEMADRVATLAAEFAKRARSLGVTHIVLGATAALREATNRVAVAGLIEERSGVPVRVLSGQDEARLVYQAVVLGFPEVARQSPCVVFDLGGGSTEVVSGLGSESGRWASIPFGAVSLTERFVRSDPVGAGELAAIADAVSNGLMHHCAYMPEVTPILAGVGGTVTVLASLDRELAAYDPSSIEGWLIEARRLNGLIDRVASSSVQQRETWPVMGTGRSDILVAGVVVVRQLAERFRSRGLICSTQGLRYGLARLAAAEAARGQGDHPGPGASS